MILSFFRRIAWNMEVTDQKSTSTSAGAASGVSAAAEPHDQMAAAQGREGTESKKTPIIAVPVIRSASQGEIIMRLHGRLRGSYGVSWSFAQHSAIRNAWHC